jgi:hypothetical protein
MQTATVKESTGSQKDGCLRCKKPRSTWRHNREGFRAHCCWGCADNSGCICDRKTYRKATSHDAAARLRLSFGHGWLKKRRIKE